MEVESVGLSHTFSQNQAGIKTKLGNIQLKISLRDFF